MPVAEMDGRMRERKTEYVATSSRPALADRIEELRRLFPEAVSEGKIDAADDTRDVFSVRTLQIRFAITNK